MKKTTTRTEVHCDLCHKPGYTCKCNACGRDMCLTCEATITGCMMQVGVCGDCGVRDDVLSIVHKYASRFGDVYAERRNELHALRDSKRKKVSKK